MEKSAERRGSQSDDRPLWDIYWRAEIPGRVQASAEALTGATKPPGTRVQLLNPPGSEVGPGQVCACARAPAQVNAREFRWSWTIKSSKYMRFDQAGPT